MKKEIESMEHGPLNGMNRVLFKIKGHQETYWIYGNVRIEILIEKFKRDNNIS